MKKYFLLPFLVLSVLCFTGCSDDNPTEKPGTEEPGTEEPAEDVTHELELSLSNADIEYFGDTENPLDEWLNYEGEAWEYTSYHTLLTDETKIFTFDCVSPSSNTGVEAGYCFSNLKTGDRSAFPKKGANTDNYIVSYHSEYLENQIDIAIRFTDGSDKSKSYTLDGLYVTNATTTVDIIENGSTVTGTDEFKDGDWFKLTIYNMDKSKSVEFYLADFRDGKSEILKEWEWVDLSSLGETTGLRFKLDSSDVGNYGMNTPAYFCLDGIKVIEKQ